MMNRRLFRILAVILCGLMTGTCVACQSSDTPASSTDASASETASEPATDISEQTANSVTEAETEPTSVVLTPQQVADTLRTGLYTASITSEACGLSNPSAIGINEAEFNTVLYPAPADDVCRRVIQVAEYGIKPENSGEVNSKGFTALMNDLSDAVGRIKIVFEPTVYRFSETLRISGLARLCFCSAEAGKAFTVLMTEWTPGIHVTNSSDIQFVDCDFDYETPSAVSGKVVSYKGKSVVIRIDDAFDLSARCYAGGTIRYGSYMEMTQDEETGDYYPDINGNLTYNSTGDQVKNIESGSYDETTHELTLNFASNIRKVKAGTVVSVAFTMYEYFGFQAESSKNIKLESIRLYHTAGMAIGVSSCENVYLNRVFLSPRADSAMLMTATADGFHAMNCTGEITVTSCVFEKSHDDCMNVNGRYLDVTAAKGNTLTVASMVVPVHEGDELDVYSKSDLHFVGTVTVKSVSNCNLTCEGVTSDMANCFAANATTSPKLTVRNCFFGNKRNRGMLIQVRNVLIENCVFRNIVHGPIQIFTVPSSFGEGICPKQITVRNCKFIGCNSTDVNVFSWAANGSMAPGVICDVTVENNYFNRSVYYPVQISTGGNVFVTNNLFDDVCLALNSFTVKSIIRVTCSRDVFVNDNCAITLPRRFTFTNDAELAKDGKSENVLFENNTVCE